MNFAAQKMLSRDGANFCRKLIAILLVFYAGPVLYGQSELTGTSQQMAPYGAGTVAAQAGYAPDTQPQSPYLGAVPTGTASPTPLSLSLEDAVARGLRQNLGGLLSADAISGARGERWRR